VREPPVFPTGPSRINHYVLLHHVLLKNRLQGGYSQRPSIYVHKRLRVYAQTIAQPDNSYHRPYPVVNNHLSRPTNPPPFQSILYPFPLN
jgi:hypothetical protein